MQLAHSSCQETNLHSKWVPKVCIFLWKSLPRAVIGLQGFWTEIPSDNSSNIFHPMGFHKGPSQLRAELWLEFLVGVLVRVMVGTSDRKITFDLF